MHNDRLRNRTRAPSGRFERPHTPPEGDALSPELRGLDSRMTLAEPSWATIGPERLAHFKMLRARDATNTMVTSADPDWSIINAFARRVSGMVSVGLKAVEFVKLV